MEHAIKLRLYSLFPIIIAMVLLLASSVNSADYQASIVKVQEDENLLTSAQFAQSESYNVVDLSITGSEKLSLKVAYDWSVIVCPKDYKEPVELWSDGKWVEYTSDKVKSTLATNWCGKSEAITISHSNPKSLLQSNNEIKLRFKNTDYYYESDIWIGEGSSKYTVTNGGGDDDDLVLFFDFDEETNNCFSDYAGSNDSICQSSSPVGYVTTDSVVGDGALRCLENDASNYGNWRRETVSFAVENESNIYESWSLCGWIKFNDSTFNERVMLSMGNGKFCGTRDYGDEWLTYDGWFIDNNENNVGSNYQSYTIPGGLSNNKWYHFCWVYDSDYNGVNDGRGFYYMNGSLLGYDDFSGWHQSMSDKLSLCTTYWLNGLRQNVTYDDICMWDNVAVNSTVVSAIYGNASLDTTCYETWDGILEGGSEPPADEGVNESTGVAAIDTGISNALSSGYSTLDYHKVYARDSDNSQSMGVFDRVVKYNQKVWAFNYVTSGETEVEMFNMTPVLYVLELSDLNINDITSAVEDLINDTK